MVAVFAVLVPGGGGIRYDSTTKSYRGGTRGSLFTMGHLRNHHLVQRS